MRALLIVNPRATATTRPALDLIAASLPPRADIETEETRYRGHARELAAGAAKRHLDAVLVLSGDGTINEAVNGLMTARDDGARPPAGRLPALAALPGGNANVFARALGVPADPAAAAGWLGSRLAAGTSRTVSLGLAGGRYFTFSAGLGWDAEVVRAVEEQRARGRRASWELFTTAALRQYYRGTDRRCPALTVRAPDGTTADGLFLTIICNTTPWTYLGRLPMSPAPQAGFDTGLDLFGMRRLRTFSTLNAIRQMAGRPGRPPTGKHVVSLHDQPELAVQAKRPVACQVDGEYVGETESVTFRSVPGALRVIA